MKRLITVEFVSQMYVILSHNSTFLVDPFPPCRYLEREKVVTGDKHSFKISWGPRSKKEVNKEAMLNFVGEIYEGDVQKWKRRFGELLNTD